MKIHRTINIAGVGEVPLEQGTPDWESIRCGKVTASEIDALVSPLGKVRDSDGVETYISQKLAEARLGVLPQNWSSAPVEYGSILEKEALPTLEFDLGVKLERVGFIESDCGRLGASPDAILDGKYGVEIKCPEPINAVRYLLANEVPKSYIMQCQFSLYVTGWPLWYFVSYRRKMPMLVLKVEPNPKIQEAIKTALIAFFERMQAAIARLEEISGEPWKRTLTAPTPESQPEHFDITP